MLHPADFSIPTNRPPLAISLFAGVGGMDLRMLWAGWKNGLLPPGTIEVGTLHTLSVFNSSLKIAHDWIDVICQRAEIEMEPWDYCLVWVKHIQPDQHGYRAECVRELAKHTFGQYKFDTINKRWGAKFEKRPDGVLQLLQASHALRTMQIELFNLEGKVKYLSDVVNKALPN